MIATKMDEIQKEVDGLNPDYVIVDTPGQIESVRISEQVAPTLYQICT